MKSITLIVYLALITVLTATLLFAAPAEPPRVKYLDDVGLADDPAPALSGDLAKAARDTVYLIGAPGAYDGRFETPDDEAHWHGWTIGDDAGSFGYLWGADTYNAANLGGPENHAAWCGADFPSCGDEDPEGGYGNGWDERLDLWEDAPQSDQPTTVSVHYDANFNTEPAFDFTELMYEKDDGSYETVFTMDGDFQGMLGQSVDFIVLPVDYVGDDQDQIHLQWKVISDGAWSDADCLYPSNGACQIDNLLVLFNQNEVSFDAFEDGPYPDGVVGNWIVSTTPPPDYYADLGRDLPEDDPDQDNTSIVAMVRLLVDV